MQQAAPWDLALNSDQFKTLCRFLNRTTPNAAATVHYDVMSGGYWFSDESPVHLLPDFDEALILPLITLLRFLWAFRLSVVRGTPRAELAEWWDSTKALAPNWSGFSPERCTEDGIRFAQFCDVRQKEWEVGVEALESKL